MAKFVVKGAFKMGEATNKFSKEVSAENENSAKAYVYSKLGSDYKCPRHKIKIESVEVSKK